MTHNNRFLSAVEASHELDVVVLTLYSYVRTTVSYSTENSGFSKRCDFQGRSAPRESL